MFFHTCGCQTVKPCRLFELHGRNKGCQTLEGLEGPADVTDRFEPAAPDPAGVTSITVTLTCNVYLQNRICRLTTDLTD